MKDISNSTHTTPEQSLYRPPIFEKPDTYLPDDCYLAEIVEAELRIEKTDYKNLLTFKSKTVKPKEEHYRLFVAFLTEDGQRFTKLFSEKMNIRWSFEAWLARLMQDEVMANSYPEGLIGLKVKFVIKNENGFSNFDCFDNFTENE